jgi:hypothetical protein
MDIKKNSIDKKELVETNEVIENLNDRVKHLSVL